jgi:succinyl-diaminopimelate desuccinylase
MACVNMELSDSVTELTQCLVRIPSQGGIDDPLPVITMLLSWLIEHGVAAEVLEDDTGRSVAVVAEIGEGNPTYCLNACLDTAPIGDKESWLVEPTGADVIDGWLLGRGAADSKIGAAIFAHIGLHLAETSLAGRLSLLFDADEHTGRFGGIKCYVARHGDVAGVMIGYPGNYGIVVGARGFWRARIDVFGTSAHSGSRTSQVDNAVVKAAALVQKLTSLDLPVEVDPAFEFGPKLTVTGIHGGSAYSTVPDQCCVFVDVRLTPSLTAEKSEGLVRAACEVTDKLLPSRRPSRIHMEESWPPYHLSEKSMVASALRSSAQKAFDRDFPLVVAGPSNIGNYLASLGIDATCGFGVTYKNLHASNEGVDLATIEPVFKAYEDAVLQLLGEPS